MENTIGPWLGRTMKMIDYHFQEVFKDAEINLSKQQWVVLKILTEEDGQPQSNLAFLTNRDKTTLTRLLSVMEKKSLVIRIPSKKDKRINHVYLTKNGKAIFDKTVPIVQNLINDIQHPLTIQEIEQMIKSLQKINEHLIIKTDSCNSN